MGVDAQFFIKTSDGKEPSGWSEVDLFNLEGTADDWLYDFEASLGANWMVRTIHRLFHENYTRGDWSELRKVALQILDSPNVEKAWYCGDSSEFEMDCAPDPDVYLLTRERVAELDALWQSRDDWRAK